MEWLANTLYQRQVFRKERGTWTVMVTKESNGYAVWIDEGSEDPTTCLGLWTGTWAREEAIEHAVDLWRGAKRKWPLGRAK